MGKARAGIRAGAKQAIITSLVNQGRSFENISSLFQKYPCAGKFKEIYQANPNTALDWLRRSYATAVDWTATHDSQTRQNIQAAIEWAQSRPWKGRQGINDRLVYLAHARIAYNAGVLEYSGSFVAWQALPIAGRVNVCR